MSSIGYESGKSVVYQAGIMITQYSVHVSTVQDQGNLLATLPGSVVIDGGWLKQSRLLVQSRGGALGCCCRSIVATVDGDFSGDSEDTRGERSLVGVWSPASLSWNSALCRK